MSHGTVGEMDELERQTIGRLTFCHQLNHVRVYCDVLQVERGKFSSVESCQTAL